MKRRIIPVLVVIVLLLLIAGGAVAARYLERYIPSKEMADVREALEVPDGGTAFFYNDERLQDVDAVVRDGQAYLPLAWVNETLNEKFYWDDVEKLLVYTLPDTVVYADKRTMGSGGKPLLLEEDDRVYLSVGLVSSYTDIRAELFDDGVPRLYLYDEWEPRTVGTAEKEAQVRVRGGIKSPILTTVAGGGEFTVLESGEEWSKVRTADGFIGWLQNKRILSTRPETPVSTFVEPEYTSLSLGERVCLVWHQTLEEADNGEMERQPTK